MNIAEENEPLGSSLSGEVLIHTLLGTNLSSVFAQGNLPLTSAGV